MSATIEELQKMIIEKDALIDKLVTALDYYADPGTYFAIGFMPDLPCGDFINDFSMTELGQKPGRTARVALGLEEDPPVLSTAEPADMGDGNDGG